MSARRPCSHRFPNCQCTIFDCRSCDATVFECTAAMRNGKLGCCPDCDHTKDHAND